MYSIFISIYEQMSLRLSSSSKTFSLSDWTDPGYSPCMFSSMYNVISSLSPSMDLPLRGPTSCSPLRNPIGKHWSWVVILLGMNALADFGQLPILTDFTFILTSSDNPLRSILILIFDISLSRVIFTDVSSAIMMLSCLPTIGIPSRYSSG